MARLKRLLGLARQDRQRLVLGLRLSLAVVFVFSACERLGSLGSTAERSVGLIADMGGESMESDLGERAEVGGMETSPEEQDEGLAGGDEGNVVSDLNANPLERGPAHVGYRSETFTYQAPMSSDPRSLRVALWYPSEAESGRGEAIYPLFSPDQAEAGARPAFSGQAPLLVYSHGAKVWPEMGSFMAEFFASHGWVVAAVEHKGDSVSSVSSDRPDEMYLWRPLDLSAVLNYLEALPSDDSLYRKVHTERAIVSGHSFGGYTSFISAGARFDLDYLRSTHCQERGGTLCDALGGELGRLMEEGQNESRFVAAIPQSAGNYEFIREGAGAVSVPTLMITATRDQSCTEEGSNQPFWTSLTGSESALRGRHRRLSFLEAGHATFTVACQHLPSLEQEDGCGADFTSYQEAQQLMLAYSLVFARAHVLGDEVALENIRDDEDLPARPSWVEWLQAD